MFWGALRGEGVFSSLCAAGDRVKKDGRTQRGRSHRFLRVTVHTRLGRLQTGERYWSLLSGLLRNQGPKIFREVEIVPGCAVMVACPSCPDDSPEPPGPDRATRNMLGWSQLEKTARSGVWSALGGDNLFSPSAGDWVKKGSYHTAWLVPSDFSCTCSCAYG